jgi:hypothetical protein
MSDPILPKLGCRPPINKPALTLSDFFTGVLPATPPVDYLGYRSTWPWWLNNLKGTCVAATWAAVKALVSAILGGREIILTDAEIVAIYKTQNPNYPAEDNGMDIQTLLEYLQKRGDIVAFGTVSLDKHDAAISIFGFVWTSVTVRDATYDDYNARRPWDYHPLSPIKGYHSILSAGHRDTAADDVRMETWTRENGLTQAFWAHDVGGTWGVILPEHLKSKEFMAGMDLPALADAFQTLTGRVLPIPEDNMQPGTYDLIGSLNITSDHQAFRMKDGTLTPILPRGATPVVGSGTANGPDAVWYLVVAGDLVAFGKMFNGAKTGDYTPLQTGPTTFVITGTVGGTPVAKWG